MYAIRSYYVVFIPGVDEADLLPFLGQGSGYQFDGDDLTEIPYVNRSGGGDAGGAGIMVLRAPFADDFIGGDVRPVRFV